MYFNMKQACTALMAAATDGRADTTLLLLDRGADMEVMNKVSGQFMEMFIIINI